MKVAEQTGDILSIIDLKRPQSVEFREAPQVSRGVFTRDSQLFKHLQLAIVQKYRRKQKITLNFKKPGKTFNNWSSGRNKQSGMQRLNGESCLSRKALKQTLDAELRQKSPD